MPQTINNKVRRGFSASAEHYDLNARLHREIADELLAQVTKGPAPVALLDVGCGTGYLTTKMKNHFPQSKIVGIDFAQGMLDVARSKQDGIEWVLGDGNDLPFADGYFNMVVSNLAYQWAGPLSRAFAEARRVLAPGGALACTLFGYNTCRELFQSLDEAGAGNLRFTRLPDQHQVHEALAVSGFKDLEVNSECVSKEFKDMYALMGWLKSIGANNLPRDGYLGPKAVSRAAAIHHVKFSSTFEIVSVYAKK